MKLTLPNTYMVALCNLSQSLLVPPTVPVEPHLRQIGLEKDVARAIWHLRRCPQTGLRNRGLASRRPEMEQSTVHGSLTEDLPLP